MSLLQFLRILWAHRWLTVITALTTVVGAMIAILIVPPSYEASSRVMLNTLKPDPVTGQILSTVSSRTYEANEIELIKDYGIVGKAVDQLGWASNPAYIQQYQSTRNQTIDIRRWLSQRIIDHTKVTPVNGTNILEISYRATTAQEARAMADALRNNYLDTSLENRRREATRLADWFTRQAQEEQGLLNAADEAKTKYERENGIVMQADDTDVDTARLRALSSQGSGGAPMVAPMPVMTSQASIQLAQLDAMIAQAAQNLGPNHPQMIELRARRATLAQVAAQDNASARASQALAANAAGSGAGAMQRAVDMQTARVIAKRDKIQRLNQLSAEVKLRRDQYTKSITRVAELRQEAAIADTGITPLGDAVEPRTPVFPNKPLILGGSSALGLALGVLLSLLIEFFGRRVRSLEDLESSFGIPTLAVITGPAKSNYPNSKSARGVFPAWLRRRPLARA